MRIGVYVGSFDPIHKGHVSIINHIISKKYVDKILLIPTGNYWDKQCNSKLIDRINMCKYYKSDTIEIVEDNNLLPYTYMLLEELNKKYKNDELYLIIGADNIKTFDLWKNVNSIIENNHILIIPRDGIDINKYVGNNNKFIIVSDFKMIDISSSNIRKMIRDNNSDVLKYIDKDIYKYIKNNRLYEE